MDNPSEEQQYPQSDDSTTDDYSTETAGEAIMHPMQLSKSHSGKILVVFFVVLLLSYTVLKFFVSPVFMQRAGVAGEQNQFDVPSAPVTAKLPVVDQLFPLGNNSIEATATWDEHGVCADVVTHDAATGKTQTHHACAKPNALETVWLIDAPNDATPSYVIAAVPHELERLRVVLDDDTFAEDVPKGEGIPAAFAVFTLPPGKTLQSVQPLNVRGWAAGEAYCGKFVALKEVEGHTWGADQQRTAGGCVVPFDE